LTPFIPNPTKLPGNAQWIGARRRATKGEPLCPYLRHSFALAGRVRRATLQWTALGVADVFLNGDKVGEDFLMQGWSDGIRSHCCGRTTVLTTTFTATCER